MIVTCTSCSKRYLVDPRALGATGRSVRCAGCGYTWFLPAPRDAPQGFEFMLPSEPAPKAAAAGGEGRVQLPAVPRERARVQLIAWAAVVVALTAVAWGLVAARTQVMALWPPSARLYAMIGYAPATPGLGLELRKVTPTRGVENGVATLSIDGEVVNVSTVVRDVPNLRVALRDANDHELVAWPVVVSEERLLPGASVAFHTTITQPSEAATGVVVSFAGPAR